MGDAHARKKAPPNSNLACVPDQNQTEIGILGHAISLFVDYGCAGAIRPGGLLLGM